jgi:aminomethyltransferase
MGWTIAWQPQDRDFIGRARLEQKKSDPRRKRFVGLLLEDKGVLRNHQRVVVPDVGDGEITSGGYSPTIGRSIALARLPAGDYETADVEVRGKMLKVRVVPIPYVRNGKIRLEL